MSDVQREVSLERVLDIADELNQLKDIDTILDRVLLESRRLSCARAGSIFLRENGLLRFRYVHNDDLYAQDSNNKHIYTNLEVPIDEKSIVGYVALTGETLTIEDAYRIPPEAPYHFNSSFDVKTGFHTRSLLTIPLKAAQNQVIGVLQIINSTDCAGTPVPFSHHDEMLATVFARHAAAAIERGLMTREMVLRMMQMAALRDPKETGAHVQRVGAYSAEIYHRWALSHGVSIDEIRKRKDLIRLAAMLHDVGKVGIADSILKKPAKLTEEEFAVMRCHTVFGADLFSHAGSELDTVCREIALHHHQRWDGRGYPCEAVDAENLVPTCAGNPGLAGEDIPFVARITAIADVFDALCSSRSYKEAWSDDRVLSILRDERGKQFDPELIDVFFDLLDVILAIRDKFV
ncbi:MAG: metal-dependent phosphohydrolase [Deltaproteobacteria bacterium HGW-Deltaproteobacteria-22]|jgi:HD-GYP domain-containing protein (c-di-GMP phosphodiesterase class II)|nr:MAG: metal-dependent phosphohydrolase [Deltaproteobacteria bacterium HGW-Deltaproteobacteria-22]